MHTCENAHENIDIPAGGGKADVVDLNDKVQDAEVVLDAEKKPVS